jgi:hypothetical protein
VQLAARVGALRVGDQCQRVALAQDVEDLAHVRVETQPLARDPAGHLGQEQRDLL